MWRGAALPLTAYYVCTNMNLRLQKYATDDYPSYMIAKYLALDSSYQNTFEKLRAEDVPAKVEQRDRDFASSLAILQGVVFSTILSPVVAIYNNIAKSPSLAAGTTSKIGVAEAAKEIYRIRGFKGFFVGF